MTVLKCKTCGGNLEITGLENIAQCSHCGVLQTLPKADDEKKIALFNRANNLRLKKEFDKAAGIYESIIVEFPNEAEAYWGVVMCKFGLEYVETKGGRRVPTCHRTLPVSVLNDDDYHQACNLADFSARALYQSEAVVIDNIQKRIIEIASSEEPYDIFICYKEQDDVTGLRTEDSSIAQDIYTAFTEKGYKVFFARTTLSKVAGVEYEPYIYAALSSAKVMLVIGTKKEYYNAVWVKNEWSRYLTMMTDDSAKTIIACYKNMGAYDLPEQFRYMQALNMDDVMFSMNLDSNVKRVLPLESKVRQAEPVAEASENRIDNILKRAYMLLSDGDFSSAGEQFDKALDEAPENSRAYLGKALTSFKLNNIGEIVNCIYDINSNLDFIKAIRFADNDFKSELEYYRIQWADNRYNAAVELMSNARFPNEYKGAAEIFGILHNYKDSVERGNWCSQKAESLSKIIEARNNISRELSLKQNQLEIMNREYISMENQCRSFQNSNDGSGNGSDAVRVKKMAKIALLVFGSIILFAFMVGALGFPAEFIVFFALGYVVCQFAFGIMWARYSRAHYHRGGFVYFYAAIQLPIISNLYAISQLRNITVNPDNINSKKFADIKAAMNQHEVSMYALSTEIERLTRQLNQMQQNNQ